MREGWEKKKLGEISSVEYGFTSKSVLDGTLRYIRITDIDKEGNLLLTDKKYIDDNEYARKYQLKENDILMARTGATFGKVLLYKDYESSVFASYLIRINFEINMINKLYWYFSHSSSYWNQANNLSSGSAQPHFNGKALKEVIFSYPTSLEEQKQIVNTLDLAFKQIDQAKANLEKNLANTKELFASKLNEVFSQRGEGWVEKKLGDLCKTGSGGTPLKSKKEYYDNGTIPWLCSGEVKQGDIYKSKKYITEIGFKNSSAKLFPSDTVLIAMYGATAGEVGILRFESSTNQAICGILPNDKLLPKFIYYSFLFRKKELIAQATGNAQPNISQIKIKNTLIPLLEKSKQINIIELLDNLQNNIDFIQTHYQQNLNNLEELKKSILEKAFKGKL